MQEQESVLRNIKMLYKAREKVINFFGDYPPIISEAKYASIHGKGIKILTPKQMLQRWPIAIEQVKAGYISENLLNEICRIIYSLYRTKKIILYNNIINSIITKKITNPPHLLYK